MIDKLDKEIEEYLQDIIAESYGVVDELPDLPTNRRVKIKITNGMKKPKGRRISDLSNYI